MSGLYFTTTSSTGLTELLLLANLHGPEEWSPKKDYLVAWTLFNKEKKQADGMVCEYKMALKERTDKSASKCIGFRTYDRINNKVLNKERIAHVEYCMYDYRVFEEEGTGWGNESNLRLCKFLDYNAQHLGMEW
jgi:hypothetical protein